MHRNRLVRRLESALEKVRRENPDGALSTYAWMWRVLARSERSRLALYSRFARLVVVDSALLIAWAVFRPVRAMLGRPRGRIVALATLGMLAFLLTRPATHPPAPWIGTPTLEVASNGLIRFEGQVVRDDQVRRIIDHYGVREAVVRIDDATTASRAFQVTELLSEAGVRRVRAVLRERGAGTS